MTDQRRTSGKPPAGLYPPPAEHLDFRLAEEAVQIEIPGATARPLPGLVPLASSQAVVEFPARGPDPEADPRVGAAAGKTSSPPDPDPSLPPRRLELRDVELVVAPFSSFREVGRFQQALTGLPEVGGVQVRHLHRGTLQIRVQCQSATALLEGLATAYTRPFTLIKREPHRIEIGLAET